MWALTKTYEPNGSTHSDPPTVSGPRGTSYYLDQAASNYTDYNYSSFTIVDAGAGSIQELIFSNGPLVSTVAHVPEPATFTLIAGSLGMLGFLRRRKQSKA